VSQQFGLNQDDLFTIDNSGELTLSWSLDGEPWHLPSTIGGALYPMGAPIVATQQFGVVQTDVAIMQTDVLAVDRSGNLELSWVVADGAWQGPTPIVTGQFTAGAHLAASQQFGAASGQTDVFAVDKFGALTVTCVVGGGAWKSAEITPRSLFPVGAPVAVSQQFVASQQFGVTQTDLFAVNTSGNLTVTWSDGPSAWQGPVGISAGAQFAAGAPVAAAQQVGLTSPQTDLFAITRSGLRAVQWAFGSGGWNPPVAIE
jgi:hypothetical protein